MHLLNSVKKEMLRINSEEHIKKQKTTTKTALFALFLYNLQEKQINYFSVRLKVQKNILQEQISNAEHS